MFTFDPIGFFHSTSTLPYELPRQAGLLPGNEGRIQLKEGQQFEQALDGLEGFDLIWVVFRFHRATGWKPKILPPRGGKKQGVFATRSPHRPNFIGVSVVKLQTIEGLDLFVTDHDLLDGTPILDLKPYLNYADAATSTKQGWLETLPFQQEILFQWSAIAQAQVDYLKQMWNCNLKSAVEHRLTQAPVPYPNHRVKHIKDDVFELAYRTWRIHYTWKEGLLTVHHLSSGYDRETLSGNKISRWDDLPIHQAFIKQF